SGVCRSGRPVRRRRAVAMPHPFSCAVRRLSPISRSTRAIMLDRRAARVKHSPTATRPARFLRSTNSVNFSAALVDITGEAKYSARFRGRRDRFSKRSLRSRRNNKPVKLGGGAIMVTTRRWQCLGMAGIGLALAGVTGCQTYVAGMTLPSGHYLEHRPQYFPPDPDFPLQRELNTQLTQHAATAAAAPGIAGPLPPPVAPAA